MLSYDQRCLIFDWNSENSVGDPVYYTDDHGKSWIPSVTASYAYAENGVIVLRIQGVSSPVRIVDVVPRQC